METFEDSLEESDNSSSGSELSAIGDDVPLGDGSCLPAAAPLFESAHSSRSMGSGSGANSLPAFRRSVRESSVRTSTPRRALSNLVNVAAPSSASNEILVELKKVNTRLESFCERLDSLDGRLKSVEDMQVNLSSSVSSNTEESASKTKRKVPSRVSQTVREVYKSLQDDDENFVGYDTKKKFSDKHNQDVVSRLVSESSKLDSHIPLVQLRDAARRFFQSTLESTALKDKGKYRYKVTQQRRRNRITRKLESRKSALMTSTAISPDLKETLKKVMLASFMSSEESGEESVEGQEEKRAVVLVKPLPWRSPRFTRILHQLDRKASRKKSKQSLQQTLPRVEGPPSARPKPVVHGLPDSLFEPTQ